MSQRTPESGTHTGHRCDCDRCWRPLWHRLLDWFDNPSTPADQEQPDYLDWQR